MSKAEESETNVRKLQTSVSQEFSDDDFNSVAESDCVENSDCLKLGEGYVSVPVDYDSPPDPAKRVEDNEEHKADNKEPCSSGNKLNSELTSFVQKKSFAQNMMDIALLSANTNQLRYVIDLGDKHPYYSTSLFLIILSLVMQVVVGLSMLYMSRYNMKNKTEMKEASHMNNLSVAGVFLVTLVNVFISTFNGTGGEGLVAKADPAVANSTVVAEAYSTP